MSFVEGESAMSTNGKKPKNTAGLRRGGGRPKGAVNKVTRELADAAQEYTEEALETLIRICRSGKSEAARVAAACAILDRGHGKPKQQIQADVQGKLTLEELVLASFRVPPGPSLEDGIKRPN